MQNAPIVQLFCPALSDKRFENHFCLLFEWLLKTGFTVYDQKMSYFVKHPYYHIEPRPYDIIDEGLTLYLIETPVIAFANRADPEQAALELPDRFYSVCLWKIYI